MDTLNPDDGIGEGQTTFELSGADNYLTLARPPTPGWRLLLRPPSRASKGILGLPDELLHDIVHLATPRHSRYNYTERTEHYRPYIALAKTCRRFHRLATAMMYSGLYLSIGVDRIRVNLDKYPVEVMRKLLRSLEENPGLGESCKVLDIMLYHPRSTSRQWEDYDLPDIPLDEEVEAHVEVVTAVAALLPGTQSIDVTGSINRFQDIWVVLGIASANMPRLEEVRINQFGRTTYGPICDSLCRAGALKWLEVSGVAETTGATKEVAKQHPVFVDKMCLSNYCNDGLESFRRLISWPERIEHLELESESQKSGRLDVPWGLRGLMPAISSQKDYLRTLAIGKVPMYNTGLSGFNVSDFPNLEELNLPYWSTGTLVAEQANLLAPRLRKFTWCFNLDGMINGMGCDISDFGEAEETWLRSLMNTAIEKGARLSHVFVDFYPYLEDTRGVNLNGFVLPWNRIDALREEFRGAGIEVTCASQAMQYEHLWARWQPGYRSPTPPPRSPPPEPGAHLPGPETDSESVVSLDGEGQANKITRYFWPVPGSCLPWPETDSESVVSLDGEDQGNKITMYFRPLPLRRKTM